MDIKSYARPYTVEDGALRGVTYWLLPFRPALAELETMELQRVDPQFVYVHKDGRRQVDEPAELKAERERVAKARRLLLEKAKLLKVKPNAAKLAKLVVKSDWELVNTWDMLQNVFCHVVLVMVDVDFPDVMPSTECSIFADFWAHKPEKVLERWALFQQFASLTVIHSLWDAYGATRDEALSAPPELGQAEPDEDSPLESGG